jgi:hypothetical protein
VKLLRALVVVVVCTLFSSTLEWCVHRPPNATILRDIVVNRKDADEFHSGCCNHWTASSHMRNILGRNTCGTTTIAHHGRSPTSSLWSASTQHRPWRTFVLTLSCGQIPTLVMIVMYAFFALIATYFSLCINPLSTSVNDLYTARVEVCLWPSELPRMKPKCRNGYGSFVR